MCGARSVPNVLETCQAKKVILRIYIRILTFRANYECLMIRKYIFNMLKYNKMGDWSGVIKCQIDWV